MCFIALMMVSYIEAPNTLYAQDQGVSLSQTGTVRQELRPFVPLNIDLVVDPLRGDVILLFPEERLQKIITPEQTKPKTEKRITLKTNIRTETGTTTGTKTGIQSRRSR
jgi:hypothetical protein